MRHRLLRLGLPLLLFVAGQPARGGREPVLVWNTFLGDVRGPTDAIAVAVDRNGNAVVTGSWQATPTTMDAVVAKFDSAGQLLWRTSLGGPLDDFGYSLALGEGGTIYAVGSSSATWGSPVRPFAASDDVFVAKLGGDGTLLWTTFLGGLGSDQAFGIQVDRGGSVYLAGTSGETWGRPLKAFSTSTGRDVFVAKLDANGSLVWNTFLGGSSLDSWGAFNLDQAGNILVAGSGRVSWGSPVRPYTAGEDVFVAKLDANGLPLWSTFLGGAGEDIVGMTLTTDAAGAAYLTGMSGTTWGAPVRPFGGGWEAFVAKLDANGALVWNTFVGGQDQDLGASIAVDQRGSIYVSGTSYATWGNPARTFGGAEDAFVAKLDGVGDLVWNAFLGSAYLDSGYGLTTGGNGDVYITGSSQRTWGVPVKTFSGLRPNGFVAKLSEAPVCIGGPTVLCLNEGRFQATAQFDAGRGVSGLAHGVSLTPDTGYLWFFSDSNVEAVLKVLDGCPVDGAYWVFVGGLTNVEVELRVTDLSSGRVKVYSNPFGRSFAPIQDVNAFSSCP